MADNKIKIVHRRSVLEGKCGTLQISLVATWNSYTSQASTNGRLCSFIIQKWCCHVLATEYCLHILKILIVMSILKLLVKFWQLISKRVALKPFYYSNAIIMLFLTFYLVIFYSHKWSFRMLAVADWKCRATECCGHSRWKWTVCGTLFFGSFLSLNMV